MVIYVMMTAVAHTKKLTSLNGIIESGWYYREKSKILSLEYQRYTPINEMVCTGSTNFKEFRPTRIS
jgi:hypothetical protein